jgi:hypothetical protein
MEIFPTDPAELSAQMYEIFFYIGLFCTIFTFTLMVMYWSMSSMKRHPNSILFQILMIQFFISIKYLVTGISFKVYGNDLAHTPKNLMDFGLLPYGCKIEGLVAYMLFFFIILWNFAFTYDVYLTVNKPMVFNENYVFYYKAFVYFAGTMFSIVVFFPNMDFFTESSIYIWYIRNGLIYNLFVNIPIILFFLVNLYISWKYTRESLYIGYTKNKHRIDQILGMHRQYFVLWTLFQVTNLVFGFVKEKSATFIALHSILMALTPLNIWVVFCKAIYFTRIDRTYQLIDTNDRAVDEELQRGTSLLNSMIMSNPPPSLRNQIKHNRNPSDSSEAMEMVKKHWETGENFKDVLRREVLEYIVKGFDKIFKDKEHEKSMEQFEIEDSNIQVEKPSFFKSVFTFWLGKEDPNKENYEDDGNRSALLGHPDVLKKVSVLTHTQVEKDTEVEKSIFIKRDNVDAFIKVDNSTKKDDEFEFIELAPTIFKNIRRIHNIDDHIVKSIFSPQNIKELDISISSGKGGSFFIKPIHGGRMLIKSITRPEYEIIQHFLFEYYWYLLMNPNTYLCPILGVFKLKLQKSHQVPPISFILMRNVLNIDPEDLKDTDKIYWFDLKGSLHGRRTLENPAEILDFENNYEFHKDLILKDIDFFQSFRRLDITTIQAERIMSQIVEDTQLLCQNNFMDYSLLLYIVIKPYQEIVSLLPDQNSDHDNNTIDRFKSIDLKSSNILSSLHKNVQSTSR